MKIPSLLGYPGAKQSRHWDWHTVIAAQDYNKHVSSAHLHGIWFDATSHLHAKPRNLTYFQHRAYLISWLCMHITENST